MRRYTLADRIYSGHCQIHGRRSFDYFYFEKVVSDFTVLVFVGSRFVCDYIMVYFDGFVYCRMWM